MAATAVAVSGMLRRAALQPQGDSLAALLAQPARLAAAAAAALGVLVAMAQQLV